MARVVIVVDAQQDFIAVDGALSVAGAEALTAPLQKWLAELDPAEVAGILFTFDTHERGAYAGSAEAAQFPLHCERDTAGWELVVDPARVDPRIPRYRLEKGVFSMWVEPHLVVRDMSGDGRARDRDEFFASLRAQGIDTITVVGVAADFCVRWAVDGLLERDFAVEVPAGLTRGIDRQIDRVAAEDWPGAPVRLI
jgi:nicotinamidase/pyrazinamidase